MSNTLKVIDMIAREALEVAHEKLTFLGTINRQYDDTFSKTGGAKGASIRLRNPNQYTRRQGSRVMDVQDQDESTQTFTVATQDGVDMRFNSQELAQSIEYLSERYIDPAVSTLVSGIESDVLTDASKSVYNLVGTAGAVVGASGDISALGSARAKLNQGLAPKDSNRAVQLDSVTMGSVAAAMKTLFHDATQVKEAFREGFISRSAMADFYENERTYSHTVGGDVAGEIDESTETNFTQGTTRLHFDGMGNAKTIKKGDVFTIESVYKVHPETKASYGVLQQFTATADALSDSGGDVDVDFSPAIYTTGAKQNVTSANAFTSAGWNDLDITFVGTADTAYRHNLMYHRDFLTFATIDLPLMDDALKCVRRVKDGLSIRVWQASDIRNDEMLLRLDILYGWKVIRPEWACRITN